MPASPEEALKKVEIFRDLNDKQIGRLAGVGRDVTSPAGKELATEGGMALAFHVIMSGTAVVSHDGAAIRTLGPGDYFGEISMIDGKPRSATVTTTSEVIAFAIPHTAFDDLLQSRPKIAGSLLVALCARIREAESR